MRTRVASLVLTLSFVAFLLASCGRGITMQQAANGKAGKCGKNWVR